MDPRARLALEDLVRGVVARDLDEIFTRLDALEQAHTAGGFAYREHVAHRRQVVAKLRAGGLSIAAIGKRLGVAASTIERDLQVTPHETPPHVLGLDGKRQSATRNGNRPAA
jgi:DNA-binding NarL/FixJ family response regulator